MEQAQERFSRSNRMPSPARFFLRVALIFGVVSLMGLGNAAVTPRSVAEIQHSGLVDFQKEILPMMKNHCLACHNRSSAKAGLILETPADMLKGGDSGPALIAGRGEASLLFKVAAHQEEPIMPPANNKSAASDLSSEQLGLLRLWIDQGATGEGSGPAEVAWQALPEGLNAIYALAISQDGQFAACGRGHEISVYHLPSKRMVAQLEDPALAKVYERPP
jgi:hypothetical protein